MKLARAHELTDEQWALVYAGTTAASRRRGGGSLELTRQPNDRFYTTECLLVGP